MANASDGRFISGFDRSSKRWTFAMATFTGLLRALPVLIVAMTIVAFLDRTLDLPAWVRACAWLVAVAGSAIALATGFRPARLLSLGERSRTLSRRARARGVDLREDELRLASELARGTASGSADLRDLYLEQTGARLRQCAPSWAHPERAWTRPVAGAALLLCGAGALWAAVPAMSPLNARVLNPFTAVNLDRFVRVTPGNAAVPLGSDVEIRLEVLEGDGLPERQAGRPDLMVRSATGWSRRVPDTEGRERRFLVRNLVEPLSYRVRWKGEWSRRYVVTPVEPVRVSGFEVEVRSPPYTGKAPLKQTSPEITGLAGSQATLTARTNRPVASAAIRFFDGREKPVAVENGNTLNVSFAVDKSGSYVFLLVPVGTSAPEQSESYPINAIEDRPPEILLLSPTEALSAGEREKIPLTFDVRDDIHVAEVRLDWELRGRARSDAAKRFEARSTGGIFTYNWNLRAAGLRPGDLARYRLVASDANTVTGPGVAATPWMEIAVESFEREHAALEQALEAWRDRSVDLLAQMNTLKAKVEKPDSNLETAAAEFNQSAQLSSRLEEALRQIVTRMENDPLADFGVTMEHKAMLDSLQQMNRSLVPSARAALNTKNRPTAAAELGNIASEIERMASLSEELTKRQNARDVVESGDRLEKLGEEMADELASASPKDPALGAKLNEMMEEARKNLEQLARSLQQMPNELPEDFVNQQALKSVQLDKVQQMLNEISEAVKRGDMKTALEKAQQFLKMTRQMRESLSQAHDSYSQTNSASDLEQKIAEQQQRLSKVIDEQRAVLAETQKLETARLERRMKAQEEAFKKLAARQRALVGKGRELALLSQQTAFYVPIASQVAPMEQIARELEAKRVDKSFELLASVTNQLQGVENEVAKSSATSAIAAPTREIRSEESAILEELKKLRDQPSPALDGEKPAYDALKQREEALSRQTGEVRQQLQTLSRKTASLGLPLTQPLNRAAQAMKAAGGALGATDSKAALPNEESALANLLETENGLSQAQSAMSAMSGRQGSGRGGPRVIARPGGSGGQRGANNGRVRLPTAEDYRPPREFREDLLESLKENYPKIYEEIIHKYYRRLAE